MKPHEDEVFTVKQAAELLGVTPHTLRAWERRYQAVAPARTETGRRTYSASQIHRLRLLLDLVNRGHSIGNVAELTEKELHKLLSHGNQARREVDLQPVLKVLAQFDFEEVFHRLESWRLSLESRDFILNVLSPLLGAVGEKVACGAFSVAHEHALSAIVRDQISHTLTGRFVSKETKKGPTLIATPEGDFHEFGILLCACLFCHHGVRAHYLGPNLPAEALSFAAKALKPARILLGNSPVGSTTESLSTYLSELHERLDAKVEVWIGGRGTIPHLRSIFGGRSYRILNSLQELDSLIGEL